MAAKTTTTKNAAAAKRSTAQKAASKKTIKTTKASKVKTKVASPRRITKEALRSRIPQSRRIIRKPKVVMGFIDFLREQSIVGLAIGLVIGTQVKAMADQMIASFINPLVGLLLPGKGPLDQKVYIMHLNDKTAEFTWGQFLVTSLSFLTTAAVVYFVFKSLKLDRLDKQAEKK